MINTGEYHIAFVSGEYYTCKMSIITTVDICGTLLFTDTIILMSFFTAGDFLSAFCD